MLFFRPVAVGAVFASLMVGACGSSTPYDPAGDLSALPATAPGTRDIALFMCGTFPTKAVAGKNDTLTLFYEGRQVRLASVAPGEYSTGAASQPAVRFRIMGQNALLEDALKGRIECQPFITTQEHKTVRPDDDSWL